MAARAGQADVVGYLLKNRANVDTKSKVRTLGLIINQGRKQNNTMMKHWANDEVPHCAGRPDSVAHLQSAGESRHCPTAAAVRRLCQCRHHLRLHPPSPGCPRRTPRRRRDAAGERSLSLLLDEGGSEGGSSWSRGVGYLDLSSRTHTQTHTSEDPNVIEQSSCITSVP